MRIRWGFLVFVALVPFGVLVSTRSFAQSFPCLVNTPVYPIPSNGKAICARPKTSKYSYTLDSSSLNYYFRSGANENGYIKYPTVSAWISAAKSVNDVGPGCDFSLEANGVSYGWDVPYFWEIWSAPQVDGSCLGARARINYMQDVDCPPGFFSLGPESYLPFGQVVNTSIPTQQSPQNGYRCVKPPPPKYPKCGDGNPIERFGGEKTQYDLDYSASGGRLLISRTYRSGNVDALTLIGNGWFLNGYDKLDVSQLSLGVLTLNLGNGLQKSFFNFDNTIWKTESHESGALVRSYTTGGEFDGWLHYDYAEEHISKFSPLGVLIWRSYLNGYWIEYVPAVSPSHGPGVGYPALVRDAYGRQISFSSDSDGLINSAEVPGGGVIRFVHEAGSFYTAAAAKNLLQVRYADETSRSYFYAEPQHLTNAPMKEGGSLLTGAVDENGKRLSTFKYAFELDPYTTRIIPRAVSTERAGGVNRYTFDRTQSGVVNVTDPLGVTRSFGSSLVGGTYFQGRLMPQGASQPAGSGCSASTSNQTFDANGNVLQRDDFNGTRSCHSHDTSRNLEVARVEGLANTQACPMVILQGSILPPNSRRISTQWHPDWHLEVRRAEPGKLTTMVYNGQPDPFNGGAVASCAPPTARLIDGKPIVVMCRRVEQATTDADGSQGFAATIRADVPARQATWTYNQTGQVLSAKGARTDVNDSTTYVYYSDTTADHSPGDLQSVTDASGKTTTYTRYTRSGQVLESTDPNGVVTINTYDGRQRLLTSSIAGETTTYTYDLAGQLITVTGPNGATVTHTYDDAQRLVQVTDAAGNRTVYTLDGLGNRVEERIEGPGGNVLRTVTRSYDALNRLQRVTGAPQ